MKLDILAILRRQLITTEIEAHIWAEQLPILRARIALADLGAPPFPPAPLTFPAADMPETSRREISPCRPPTAENTTAVTPAAVAAPVASPSLLGRGCS